MAVWFSACGLLSGELLSPSLKVSTELTQPHEEAIEAYDAALVIRPDFTPALFNKGLALDELGRREEAIQAFDTALEVRPDLAEAMYMKIIALLMQQREEEAIEQLCQAWRTRDQLSDTGAGLVRLFRILGKEPEECP